MVLEKKYWNTQSDCWTVAFIQRSMEETKSKNQRRRLNYWLQWQKSEQDRSIFAVDILPNRANKALLNVVLPPLPNLKCCTLQTKDAYKLSFPSGKFALLQLALAEFFHALTRIVQSTNQLLPSPSCAHARRLCRGLGCKNVRPQIRLAHQASWSSSCNGCFCC